MQWNANELAWAKKNNVQLGQKTKGGLANVAAYRKSAGLAPQGGGGGLKMQPAGGGGGGLIQGRAGGAQQAYGAGQPTMKKGAKGALLGGALGATAGFQGAKALGMAALGGSAKAGAITGAFSKGAGALFGAGKMGAIMGGPVGWGLAAGLLGASLLGNKKTNKQFEGEINTGGAQAFKGQGGQMAVASDGYIPTADEFVNNGRWLLGKDSYAHDYGRTFGESDRKYYDNFQKQASSALQSGNKAQYKQIMQAHGFDVQGAPKPEPRRASRSAPEPVAEAPAPVSEPKREEVSKPGQGLESTIKNPPKETVERPGLKPGVNKYNVPKSRKRRAGFFSYAGSSA